MPISISQLPSILNANTEANQKANEAVIQGMKGEQAERQEKLKNYLQGQTESARQQQSLGLLNDPNLKGALNEGGSYSVDPETGKISVGANPYAKMMMQGPHQAQTFLKNAQTAYRPINDQLDAAQATIDALNQGNSSSDKLALISEAKLATGTGGSRALKSVMDSMTGGKTSGMQYQEAINYIENTPNIPTMQPAQRDAIRESVFARMPQIVNMHNQAKQSLQQQGPAIAPQADTTGLTQSVISPVDQKLTSLKQMQSDYYSKRQQMQNQPPVSQPSTANQNPTTIDRLKSLFNIQSSPQTQQQPATAQVNHSDDVAQELAKRAKQSLNQPPQQPQQPGQQPQQGQ